jgi:drug/metabolite transporter (DMT)-like permease
LKDYDHPLVVVLYFPLVTVPVVGPFTYLTWVMPEPLDWLILIIIGIAVTAAQIYMTRAYQADKAANISNYNYLGSVYAIVLGWALFGEMMGTLSLVGIALIIAGVVLGSRYGRN